LKSNINALEYEAKVERLINAILEADRLLALRQLEFQKPELDFKEAA